MIYCTRTVRNFQHIETQTTAATATFFYLMAVHPAAQRKAQAELDRVLGHGHLPTFEDRYQLPYTEAIYRELLRWRPPVAMCVPHISTEDDEYKGYYIPKGICGSFIFKCSPSC